MKEFGVHPTILLPSLVYPLLMELLILLLLLFSRLAGDGSVDDGFDSAEKVLKGILSLASTSE